MLSLIVWIWGLLVLTLLGILKGTMFFLISFTIWVQFLIWSISGLGLFTLRTLIIHIYLMATLFTLVKSLVVACRRSRGEVLALTHCLVAFPKAAIVDAALLSGVDLAGA